ncbi:MAG: HDOD domain-containing protein [Desulfobacteraceae bacterium]|nr:MAG: HDOD domain-containing protein [Desulfobacteraceae bacterium]
MPRLQVASGSYVVNGKTPQILEAQLGTCVGVSLCDQHTSVGGLIHLLLPEPTGMQKDWQPVLYAATGLPLFLQALGDAGASKDNLKAFVAGGALIGPLSEKDLILNIGGRTTEIVEEILHREGISISKSETGGYFSCRLALNTETWESHIEPAGISTTPSEKAYCQKPTFEQIEDTVERVRPIPQIALKIIRMIHDDNYSMKHIAEEVRLDQIISAKVIRLCNSAFFGLRVKVDTLDRALVMIGEKKLMQLVVSASLEDFFPETEQGYSLCKGGLYRHALGTAMVSERLAEVTGKASGGLAYTAGLLHDIGKVVLDQYLAPAYPLFYRRTQIDGINLIEIERDELGITHTEAGGKLAERWSLPETLGDTIRHHHHPEQACVSPELTHLIYLADLLMSRFAVGNELERLNTHQLTSRLQKVDLRPEQFPMIVESIPDQLLAESLLDGFK